MGIMNKKNLLMTTLFAFLNSFSFASMAYEGGSVHQKESWFELHASIEYGVTSVVGHAIQFGSANPTFNLAKEGGQTTLFPFWRFGVEMQLLRYHTLELLYQPIYLDTQGVSAQNVQFDLTAFAAGTPIDSRYYFPFYRLSYFYHIVDDETVLFSMGGGLQIRNTTIAFASANGANRFATSNVGPVPLVTARFKYNFANGLWVVVDAGGIWAPIPGLNGSGSLVTGWLYDAAVQGGLDINDRFLLFMSARLIGGGANGDGVARDSGQTYSYNALNALNFSTGLTYHYPGI